VVARNATIGRLHCPYGGPAVSSEASQRSFAGAARGFTSGLASVRSEASVGHFLSALLRERDDKSAFRSRLQ
jgi:hypothetical protein